MPAFEYAAVDRAGIRIHGVSDSASRKELTEMLEAHGFTLVSAKSKASATKSKTYSAKMSRRDLIDFTYNIAILEASGVPLFEGLTDLSEQVENPQLKAIFNELVADVGRGLSLSEAMGRFHNIFPPLYIYVVKAGEQSGALDQVLSRLAEHLEWRDSIRGLVKQLLIYPTVLMCAVTGLVIFLLSFLIPRLMQIYSSTKVALPVPTQVLIALSNFIRDNWFALAGVAVALVSAFVITRNTNKGRLAIDHFILRIPIVGPVVRKVAASQFAATLATLYRAGVDLEQALEITSGVIENKAMSKAVKEAQERVLTGVPLSEAIKGTKQFQPLVNRMIAIGEKAGRLEEALGKVVGFYDREVPRAVKRFMSLIEPAITIIAGFIVGFIILCAMLPIFKLFEALRK